MRRGERKLIPALGNPQYLHVFGAYNWHSGRVSYLTSPHKNMIPSSPLSNTSWRNTPVST